MNHFPFTRVIIQSLSICLALPKSFANQECFPRNGQITNSKLVDSNNNKAGSPDNL